MGLDLLVDVAELRVPVRVPLALDGLGVALQAEPLLPQQVTDGVGAADGPGGSALLPGHGSTSLLTAAATSGRPAHPAAPAPAAPGAARGSASAARLRPAPGRRARPSGSLPRVQLIHSQGHRGLADPRSPGHQPDPAMAQRPRLGPHQQPPLPLIQMREDHLELRRQHLPGNLHHAHTTSACRIPGSYGLFSGKL